MERLERIVNEPSLVQEQPTLRQELSQSIKAYPKTWKGYFKQITPAILVSSVGAAAGQWAAQKMGYDSNAAMTAAAYVCGYIPGYSTFFGIEFLRNRDKYKKVFSKEFGEFAGTFMAADYVSDITTFTPVFIASNLWMANNTEIHPAVRSLIAWNSAGWLYLSTMSALHPLTRRINNSINEGVRKTFKKIRGKNISLGKTL